MNLARVLWRLQRAVFARRLVPMWVALGAFYAVFEQAIRPLDIMRNLAAMTPLESSLWGVFIAGCAAMMMRRHARVMFYGERLAPLWRLPISAPRWSFLMAPHTALMAAPVCVCALLWPSTAAANVVTFAAASHPLLLAVGGVGLRAPLWFGASLILLGGNLYMLRALPGAAWSSALVGLLGVSAGGLLGAKVYDDLRGQPGALAAGLVALRPRQRLLVLMLRDMRCLWRCDRGTLLGAILVPLPLAAFVFAVARHGGPPGTTLAALAALIAPLSSLLTVRLQGRLGEQFQPRRANLTSGERMATLLLIANLPMMMLYAASIILARGWSLEQAIIAASALPLLASAPVMAVIATRWWSNAGHAIPFLCLFGFFLTRLPGPAALASGIVSGVIACVALARLLERIRERTL